MSFLSVLSRQIKGLIAPTRALEESPAEPVSPSAELVSRDEFTTHLARAIAAVEQKHAVTLVHGRAGTGKTTLIQKLVKSSKLNHVIVAPTGVAALNAGGQTIHSFFGLPPRMINLDEIEPRRKLQSILRRIDFVVIDEISMVRADLLDAVERTLRVNRGLDKPFGGVPMIFVGDFLQLPPVVEEQDKLILQAAGYDSHFAFGAKCVQALRPHLIELNVVYRQKERDFIDLLGRLREGDGVPEAIQTLNAACCRTHRADTVPVTLTATIASADRYNRQGLSALRSDLRSYTGIVDGEFARGNRQRLPAPEFLDLKVDARVMLVKNDPAHRWVNGSLGTVKRLDDESVRVRLDETGEEHHVTRESWESIRYEWDYEKQRIAAKVVGTYSQIPLTPAWALTIHKAQGLTLSDVRVDLSDGAFAEGQTYVALSRAKTLDGLSLAKPISVGDVRVNPDLVDAVRRLAGTGTN